MRLGHVARTVHRVERGVAVELDMSHDHSGHLLLIRRHTRRLGDLDFVAVLEWSSYKITGGVFDVNRHDAGSVAIVPAGQLVEAIGILAALWIFTGLGNVSSIRIGGGRAFGGGRFDIINRHRDAARRAVVPFSHPADHGRGADGELRAPGNATDLPNPTPGVCRASPTPAPRKSNFQ